MGDESLVCSSCKLNDGSVALSSHAYACALCREYQSICDKCLKECEESLAPFGEPSYPWVCLGHREHWIKIRKAELRARNIAEEAIPQSACEIEVMETEKDGVIYLW
jgi:hypothetical protein